MIILGQRAPGEAVFYSEGWIRNVNGCVGIGGGVRPSRHREPNSRQLRRRRGYESTMGAAQGVSTGLLTLAISSVVYIACLAFSAKQNIATEGHLLCGDNYSLLKGHENA